VTTFVPAPRAHQDLAHEVSVDLGPEVGSACLGYALARLRGLADRAVIPLGHMHLSVTLTGHPERGRAVRAEATVLVSGVPVRTSAVGGSARQAVRQACDRLGGQLPVLPEQPGARYC
jgi:hypothetical protein